MASNAISSIGRSRLRLLFGFIAGAVGLLACLLVSLGVGSADLSVGTVYDALVNFDGSTPHLIVRTVRLPRSLVAVSVGASLATAGAIAQGLTRNPLASPGILGINAGAAFAVVAATFLLGSASLHTYASFGFAGAALAAIAVYTLGSTGGGRATPLKLAVAGAALAALLSSLTTAMLVLNQRTLDEIRFWLAGSVAGRDLTLFWQNFPYLAIGLLLAFGLGRQITVLSLGEETAKGLGQQTVAIKLLATACVVLLAGSSVAIAGPIGFIGLVVPHMVRFAIGIDYRWILPYSAIGGAILLLLADMVARTLMQPQELPVGVMTALLGAPFFIYLALKRRT